jgi:D-tyrosyl-tRNA(Tyr) deacylase
VARAVLQRVRRASVTVEGEPIARIGVGLAILLGVARGDTPDAVEALADKIAVLRIFEDDQGKMNLAASDVQGEMLVVSQFTLFADVHKGRRPSFIHAAEPELGRALYERFAARLASRGYRVERGQFGAHMVLALENDGPVTIILDSQEL